MGDLSLEDAIALLDQPKAPQEQSSTSKPATKRLIRTTIHYPNPGKTRHVTQHDTLSPNKSLRCASRGCSSPTVYKLDNIPYCSGHIIFGLGTMVDRLESEVSFLKKGYGNL